MKIGSKPLIAFLSVFAALLIAAAVFLGVFLTTKTIVYLPCDGGEAVFRYEGRAVRLTIPETHDGAPVPLIAEYAFGETKVEEVDIGAVRTIERFAFQGCEFLKRVDLRAAEHIQTGAFYGCSQLTELTIPATVHTIGAEAFAACGSLTSVYFEGDPQNLGNNIFPVREQSGAVLTIYGTAGGSVEAYAEAAGIPFEARLSA